MTDHDTQTPPAPERNSEIEGAANANRAVPGLFNRAQEIARIVATAGGQLMIRGGAIPLRVQLRVAPIRANDRPESVTLYALDAISLLDALVSHLMAQVDDLHIEVSRARQAAAAAGASLEAIVAASKKLEAENAALVDRVEVAEAEMRTAMDAIGTVLPKSTALVWAVDQLVGQHTIAMEILDPKHTVEASTLTTLEERARHIVHLFECEAAENRARVQVELRNRAIEELKRAGYRTVFARRLATCLFEHVNGPSVLIDDLDNTATLTVRSDASPQTGDITTIVRLAVLAVKPPEATCAPAEPEPEAPSAAPDAASEASSKPWEFPLPTNEGFSVSFGEASAKDLAERPLMVRYPVLDEKTAALMGTVGFISFDEPDTDTDAPGVDTDTDTWELKSLTLTPDGLDAAIEAGQALLDIEVDDAGNDPTVTVAAGDLSPDTVPMGEFIRGLVSQQDAAMRATHEAPPELMGGPVDPVSALPGETSAAIGPKRRLSLLEDGTWCAFVVVDGQHLPYTRCVGDTPVDALSKIADPSRGW